MQWALLHGVWGSQSMRSECGVGSLRNLNICWYACLHYFNSILISNNGFGCLFCIPKRCRISDTGASRLSYFSKYSVGYSHLKMGEHSNIDAALIGRSKVILGQITLRAIMFFSLRHGLGLWECFGLQSWEKRWRGKGSSAIGFGRSQSWWRL